MILAANGKYASPDMVAGSYEPETTRLLEQLLKPGDCFIDIGAHAGYYALLAARRVGPDGNVFAFEPEPINYRLLVNNIALNRYSNVRAVPKAIGRMVGSTALYLSDVDNGQHSTVRLGTAGRRDISVEVTTLDAFLEAEGWPRVDVVKIDIEGGESDALDGMQQFLQRTNTVTLVIEFCPWILQTMAVSPSGFVDRLRTLGFFIQGIELKGLRPLTAPRVVRLTERLLQAHSYINLLCTKPANAKPLSAGSRQTAGVSAS
jgi:FkbM family methyltransferase